MHFLCKGLSRLHGISLLPDFLKNIEIESLRFPILSSLAVQIKISNSWNRWSGCARGLLKLRWCSANEEGRGKDMMVCHPLWS